VATMRSKHPGVRVTVKRMSTARIVVLSIAPGAGGIAASLARGFAKPAETLTEGHQTGTPAWALRSIPADQASKRSQSVDVVRYRIAIPTTAQK
jgi:hypothetical protein